MRYVFDFDHAHRRAPKELKDLLGGKGANLAEMTSVLQLPVPPGFTITTDACRAWHRGRRCPKGSSPRSAARAGRLERAMGKRLGDADDPLLVSVRSGAKFSMPGHDGHGPQPRPQRRSPSTGSPRQTDDRRFALDSYRRFIADVRSGSCSASSGHAFDDAVRPRESRRRCDERRRACPPSAWRQLVDELKAIVRSAHGGALPRRTRRSSCCGAVEAVFRAGTATARDRLPPARGHLARPRHGRQRPGDGLREPRRRLGHRRRVHAGPRDGRAWRLRRLPRERPGRGRRRRHPRDRAAEPLRARFPKVHDRAARDLQAARAALPRHVRHGVHDRAGPAVDAPDPGGQAHRPRRAAHGRRDDRADGPAHLSDARRSCGSPRSTSTRCCIPSSLRDRARPRREGSWRLAGRGGRARLLLRGRARSPRRAAGSRCILVRTETSPDDVARHARRDRASSPRAAASSRTRPSSRAAGASRPSSAPRPSS